MIADLIRGPTYLLRGYRLIFHPGLGRFFLIPLFVNTLVFAGMIWVGVNQFGVLLGWFLPEEGSWWANFARGVLWSIFAVAAGAFMFLTFTLVANLIAAPFNGLLAERVERTLDSSGNRTVGRQVSFLQTVGLSLVNELRKLFYLLAIILLSLTLTLIPVVNLLAPLIWVAVTSWLLAVEYLAYPLENQGMQFSEVRYHVKARRLLAFSFGAAVLLATLVPVVNLAVMPASVAGATVMWIERGNRGQTPPAT